MSLIHIAIESGCDINLDYFISGFEFDACIFGKTNFFETNKKRLLFILGEEKLVVFRIWAQKNNVEFLNEFELIYIDPQHKDFVSINDYPLIRIKTYGKPFVDELSSKYKYAYLNYLIGEKESKLKVINRDNEIRHGDDFSEISLISDAEEKYIIHESIPDRFSKENELLFQAFLKSHDEYCGMKCAIFIGNGVSIPFGADNWQQLIDNMVDYLNPFYINDNLSIESELHHSSYAISSFVQTTLFENGDANKYFDAIYYCVYRKLNNLMFEEDTLIKAIALGKIKYPYLPLLTYNYDTFVEQQYSALSHKKMIPVLPNNYVRFNSNEIIHLHGYIDYDTHNHEGLILTDTEYFDAYTGYKTKNTRFLQTKTLREHYCLFVGSSMSDLFQMSIINNVKQADPTGKWCCFALMCLKNLSLNEKIHLIKYYRSKGIYLITVDSFAELPKKLAFLLGIDF